MALTSQSPQTQKLKLFHISIFLKVFSSGLNNTNFSSWLVGALLYNGRRRPKKLEAYRGGKRDSYERDVEELAKEGHSSHTHLGTVSSGQELIKEGYFLLYVCVYICVWLCLFGFIEFKPWHQCREIKDYLVPCFCAIL